MGLDTVDLIVAFEKYFEIEIPNAQAETLVTLQHVTDIVSEHFSVTGTSLALKERIFDKIKIALNNPSLELNDLVSKHISGEKWTELKETLQLEIPTPLIKGERKKTFIQKIFPHTIWQLGYDPSLVKIEDLVDAICVCNYKLLVDRKKITNKYEIYVAVAGITVNQAGVDYYEVGPGKSFTNDLGMD